MLSVLNRNFLIQIFMLLYFPVIGNAISYRWFPQRRLAQVVVLVLTLLFIFKKLNYRGIANRFKNIFFKKIDRTEFDGVCVLY